MNKETLQKMLDNIEKCNMTKGSVLERGCEGFSCIADHIGCNEIKKLIRTYLEAMLWLDMLFDQLDENLRNKRRVK
jgi:hypothetical protein